MDITAKNMPTRNTAVYNKLAALFDEGTFAEFDAYQSLSDTLAGVVCGYGSVDCQLVFAFAQDEETEKGAMDTVSANKIAALYEKAIRCGAPVVGIYASAGSKITEGTSAASALGKLMKAMSRASGIIPQIAVIDGNCSGLAASAAAMSDVIIASKNAKYYVNPPIVLRKAGVEGAGSVESAAKSGIIDIVCDSTEEAVLTARKVLSLLPQNNNTGSVYAGEDDPERDSAAIADAKDAREILSAVCDSGSFVEFKKDCGSAVIGLAPIGSLVAGVVATDGGNITSADARKIASFVSFCDSFCIPVVTFVNSTGVEACDESAPIATDLAKLAMAYGSSDCAKITVITGKAYGAAFTVLGSKSLGADLVLARESAEISIMAPDAAVQFLFGEEIKADANPAEHRKELTEKWIESNASALGAAKNGDVDLIVSDAELRARVASALQMLWTTGDGSILKKHSKLPF
ncbi:MAG: acetyl-CoA carboxylase [Clostridia bacterium]|nr:acetyl-CoA carboxylase [Clostridia bacterium]